MDNNAQTNMADNKITCFDKASSSNHIQMLKILLHYIPETFRKHLSVYIKFLELQQVMFHPFHYPPSEFRSSSATSSLEYQEPFEADFSAMISELLPFCNAQERSQFQNLGNMLRNFEQMKNMMEMMQMINEMKDMFGTEENGFTPDMLAGMMGMSGPDLAGFNPDILAAMMGQTTPPPI